MSKTLTGISTGLCQSITGRNGKLSHKKHCYYKPDGLNIDYKNWHVRKKGIEEAVRVSESPFKSCNVGGGWVVGVGLGYEINVLL